MAASRYSDIDLAVSGAHDFIIRRRTPTLTHLTLIFASILLVITCVSLAVTNRFAMVTILFAFVALMGWYIILVIQRNRDLVLATEFQNALFASALGLNHRFCFIIKRDGNIVYLDQSFQQMFPDFVSQPRRMIDVLLDQAHVAKEDCEKIFSAIERGIYDKIIFNIRDSHRHTPLKIIMSIEPILRPSGFILMRGREYVETRSDSSPGAPMDPAHQPSIALFSYIIDTLNIGVYMCGPSGNIIYVNPVLEQWLGFSNDEITAVNLTLSDLVYRTDGSKKRIDPADFEGETALKKKSGDLMKVFINQKLILDPQKKIIGCTGLVHQLESQSPEVKKKLW